jgi:hypothetical protein
VTHTHVHGRSPTHGTNFPGCDASVSQHSLPDCLSKSCGILSEFACSDGALTARQLGWPPLARAESRVDVRLGDKFMFE